jgi:hypothetical protein
LGIGTSSPAEKLTVQSTGNSIGSFRSSGASYVGVEAVNSSQAFSMLVRPDVSNALVFRNETTSTNQLILNTSGNLGLGVTPSAWVAYKALQVGSTGGALSSSSSSDFEITTNAYYSGGWLSQGAGVASSRYRLLSGTHAWFNAPSGTAGNAITFTQAMTLDASGNLGVGITSPTARFHIQSATTGSVIVGKWTDGTTDTGYLTTVTGGGVGVGAGGFLTFGAGGGASFTERARIDSSGNIQVGTTTRRNNATLTISYSGSTNNGIAFIDTANANGTEFLAFQNSSATNIGTVARVGTTNAVVYNTTSDYRLKTVTGAVTGQGSRIDALKPIDYLWTEGGQQARGFLAHEFQTVYPNSVTGDKDALDANGNPKYQSMQAATSEVIADLVAEIQSLRQRLSAANL